MSIEEERAAARFRREQSESKPKTYSSFGNFANRQNDIYAQRDRAQKAVYDAYEANRQELVKAFSVSDTNPRAISRQQYDQLSKAARETRDSKIQAIRSATSKALRQNNQIRDQERGLDRSGKVPAPQFISIGDFGQGFEYSPVALPESYYQSPDYVRPPDPVGSPLSQAIGQAARGNITQEQLNQAIQENAKATEALVPKVEMPETFVDVQRKQAKEIFDRLNITPEMIEGGPANYEKALQNYATAIGMIGVDGVTKRLQDQVAPPPPPNQIMEYRPPVGGAMTGAPGNVPLGLSSYDTRPPLQAPVKDPYENAFQPFTGSYAYQQPQYMPPPQFSQQRPPQQQFFQSPQFPQQQQFPPQQQYFSPYMNQFQPAGQQFYQQPYSQPQQMGFQPQGGKGFQPQGGMRGGFQPQFSMGGKGGGGKGGFY